LTSSESTRKENRRRRKEERKAARAAVMQEINKALAEKESIAKAQREDTQAAVKDLKIQLSSAQSKVNPQLLEAQKKVTAQTTTLRKMRAKYASLKPGDAKSKLDKEMAKVSTRRALAEEEQNVLLMDVNRLKKRLVESTAEHEQAAKLMTEIRDQKESMLKKMTDDQARAKQLSKMAEDASDKEEVQHKALERLSTKIPSTEDVSKRQKLQNLLDATKGKLEAASKETALAEQKESEAWEKEWGEMDRVRLKLARSRVETLSKQAEASKLLISRLYSELQKSQDSENDLQVSTSREDVDALQNVVAGLEDETELKESNRESGSQVQPAQKLAAMKKVAEVQKQKLANEKKLLAATQGQVKLAIKNLADLKKSIAFENSKRQNSTIQVKEAKEKQQAARNKILTAQQRLAEMKHPKGQKKVEQKLTSAQKDEAEAKAEVERVETAAAKAHLREKQETRQKQHFELKINQAKEQEAHLQKQTKNLQMALLKPKSKSDRIKLKVQIEQKKQELTQLQESVGSLSRSITDLKVEGAAEHAERKAIEQSARNLEKVKFVTNKQIKNIKKQLESPGGLPAAQKLKLDKELASAQRKKDESDQKLADAKQKLRTADTSLQRRLAYRGIKWRKAKLQAAKIARSRASKGVHLLRLRTRDAREKLDMNARTTSFKIAKLQKHMASAKAALDALKGIEGMEPSRNKLQSQIQTIKLDLKQRMEKLQDLNKDKQSFMQSIRVATAREDLAMQQLEHHEKKYRRARVLGEADDKLASKIKDKITFIGTQMAIVREEKKYSEQEQAIAQVGIKIVKETNAAKKVERKEHQFTMIEALHDIKTKIKHMKIEAKMRKKLLSCRSEATSLGKVIRQHVRKAQKIELALQNAHHKIVPKGVAARLDKDAQTAMKNAATRTKQKKLELSMATKSSASQGRMLKLKGELKLAEKDQETSELRAAAAAQAGSPETMRKLTQRVQIYTKKLKDVRAKVAEENTKLQKLQTCQQLQEQLIAKQERAFLKGKLEKVQSDNGNMFDERHQNAADEIHQIEKAAYQAKFRVDFLKDKHKKYLGALGVMMKKLPRVVGKKKVTYEKLARDLKKKAQLTRGALTVAKQKHSTAEEIQLEQAVRIAKGLAAIKTANLPFKHASASDEDNETAITTRNSRKQPDDILKRPSAVHAAVLQILASPA